MGSDKALLAWQGIPLLQRVYQVAQQCCARVCVITPWPEKYRPLLPHSVDWLVESPTQGGPLVALAQGLEAVSTPWVLLLACDMPCLDAIALQNWIQTLPLQNPEAFAYVPLYKSRWEPLCGFYHVEGISSLKAFIAAGGRSCQQWLSPVQAVPLMVDDAIAPMLRNCNTPEDLVEH
jgi:molybdenum cofactor guanylyltransferase